MLICTTVIGGIFLLVFFFFFGGDTIYYVNDFEIKVVIFMLETRFASILVVYNQPGAYLGKVQSRACIHNSTPTFFLKT